MEEHLLSEWCIFQQQAVCIVCKSVELTLDHIKASNCTTCSVWWEIECLEEWSVVFLNKEIINCFMRPRLIVHRILKCEFG